MYIRIDVHRHVVILYASLIEMRCFLGKEYLPPTYV